MQQNKLANRHQDIYVRKTETAVALQLVGWHMCACVLRTHTLNAFRERKSSEEAADKEGQCISQSHTGFSLDGI